MIGLKLVPIIWRLQVSTGLSSHVSVPYIMQFYSYFGTIITYLRLLIMQLAQNRNLNCVMWWFVFRLKSRSTERNNTCFHQDSAYLKVTEWTAFILYRAQLTNVNLSVYSQQGCKVNSSVHLNEGHFSTSRVPCRTISSCSHWKKYIYYLYTSAASYHDNALKGKTI